MKIHSWQLEIYPWHQCDHHTSSTAPPILVNRSRIDVWISLRHEQNEFRAFANESLHSIGIFDSQVFWTEIVTLISVEWIDGRIGISVLNVFCSNFCLLCFSSHSKVHDCISYGISYEWRIYMIQKFAQLFELQILEAIFKRFSLQFLIFFYELKFCLKWKKKDKIFTYQSFWALKICIIKECNYFFFRIADWMLSLMKDLSVGCNVAPLTKIYS